MLVLNLIFLLESMCDPSTVAMGIIIILGFSLVVVCAIILLRSIIGVVDFSIMMLVGRSIPTTRFDIVWILLVRSRVTILGRFIGWLSFRVRFFVLMVRLSLLILRISSHIFPNFIIPRLPRVFCMFGFVHFRKKSFLLLLEDIAILFFFLL